MTEPTTLTIRLTPRASKNAIVGWTVDENGAPVLKVSVTTVPEKGKANEALVKLLAKEWHIPKSSITIVRGETDRVKILSISAALPPQIFAKSDS